MPLGPEGAARRAEISVALAAQPKPTAARPREVAGFTWRCYTTGICKTEWRADGAALAVGDRQVGTTYWATANGALIGKRFRSRDTAMKAAAKALKS